MDVLLNFAGKNKELRILFLEDSEDDEFLVKFELAKLKIPIHLKRIYTQETYIQALETFSPDVILLDYNLPAFSGLEALELKRFYNTEVIPVIFVSGFLGEEKAVEAIKKGASDFVLKGNLSRLPFAISNALRECHEKKQRIEFEVASRRSEAKYRQLVEQAADGIFVYDENFRFMEVNGKACELLGYDKEELLQINIDDIIPKGVFSTKKSILGLQVGGSIQFESLRKKKDGTVFPVEVSVRKTTLGFFPDYNEGHQQA